jgi:hypothetical protein
MKASEVQIYPAVIARRKQQLRSHRTKSFKQAPDDASDASFLPGRRLDCEIESLTVVYSSEWPA